MKLTIEIETRRVYKKPEAAAVHYSGGLPPDLVVEYEWEAVISGGLVAGTARAATEDAAITAAVAALSALR